VAAEKVRVRVRGREGEWEEEEAEEPLQMTRRGEPVCAVAASLFCQQLDCEGGRYWQKAWTRPQVADSTLWEVHHSVR